MAISVFDLFSIGIGPSSSHTVGPMRAAYQFANKILSLGHIEKTKKITIDLYGSLALTGKGHATDIAILLGLQGETPEHIDPSKVTAHVEKIRKSHTLNLLGKYPLHFTETN